MLIKENENELEDCIIRRTTFQYLCKSIAIIKICYNHINRFWVVLVLALALPGNCNRLLHSATRTTDATRTTST